MYILSKQLQDLPIISLQTGQAVSVTKQPIINPDKLEITAFYCTDPHHKRNRAAVLLVQDIRQTAREGLVIDSLDEIEDPNEIIRLQPILEHRFDLLGISVINESSVRLGKVEEFTVNLNDFQIQKLYLKQSVFKNLLLNNLVIDRSQIIEVTTKQITVRDATVKKHYCRLTPPSLQLAKFKLASVNLLS